MCPVVTELFHANGLVGGRTDRHDEANIFVFCYFANAPKNHEETEDSDLKAEIWTLVFLHTKERAAPFFNKVQFYFSKPVNTTFKPSLLYNTGTKLS